MISPRLERQLLEAHDRVYGKSRRSRTLTLRARRLGPVLVALASALVISVSVWGATNLDLGSEIERPASNFAPSEQASAPPEAWGERRQLEDREVAELQAAFAVLRRPHEPRDVLPPRRDTAREQIVPSLSRLATEHGSVRVYFGVASFVGGEEQVCAFAFVNDAGAGSSNCTRVDVASSSAAPGKFSTVTVSQDDSLLFGVVPDDVQRATAQFDGGKRVEVPVRGNVLALLGDSPPESLTIETRDAAPLTVDLADLR